MPTLADPTPETLVPPTDGRVVLHDVPWELYEQLRDVPANNHVRMTYFNGTLELMSPQLRHEKSAVRLGKLVSVVTEVLGIPCTETRSTTFGRRGRKGRKSGAAKEPDTSFYVAHEAQIRDKDEIDLTVDPPPDLAIEVDNTADSEGKLPVYAALRVPEVWRYDARAKTIWFGRLQADGTYAPIERSDSLPLLTPALVVEALALGQGLSDTEWVVRLRDWVRNYNA